LAPLKAQVGLIHDRYKPKHPADRWLPRTQPPLRSSGLDLIFFLVLGETALTLFLEFCCIFHSIFYDLIGQINILSGVVHDKRDQSFS
jgi:hypothetical protein